MSRGVKSIILAANGMIVAKIFRKTSFFENEGVVFD
jgi:hypothetical protein